MDCTVQYLPYASTGSFSKIITDYLAGEDELRPFYAHPVSLEGIKAAIEKRRSYKNNRELLVSELKKQYQSVELSDKVSTNIGWLADEDTFTICTAHQPNIFTVEISIQE